MIGQVCVAAARAAVLGMAIGTACAAVAWTVGELLLGVWFGFPDPDDWLPLFTAIFYAGAPVGAAIGAWLAARSLAAGVRETAVAAASAGIFVLVGELAMVLLAGWLEGQGGGGNPWLAPTALLAPLIPAAMLSAAGRALVGRPVENRDPGRPGHPWRVVGLALLGALIGLPLAFFGAMAIGMAYAQSIGVCSIGAIGHAALSVVVGPVVGAWMGWWAALKWG